MNKIVSILLALTISFPAFSQKTTDNDSKMEWFKDAKLGIFIHWGIYSVNGIDESWSFYNNLISYDDYMKQLHGFTASNYDPAYWAKLIKESGAKYAVLTTKHHDGVALWDTKFSDLNVVKKTPAARDLIKPYVDNLKKNNIKVGFYYSLLDWSHPDYPKFKRNKKRYNIKSDSVRWDRFLKFDFNQIGEIVNNYNPDLIWFDGNWEVPADRWHGNEIKELILRKNKNIILNGRLHGYGDYATREQGLPIHKPKDKYWELCMTMNDSWGYQGNDKNYKTPYQIIRIFADVISMGGNLLLDIGPKQDGTIPEEQENILQELGKWTSKNKQAIYGTEAGIPRDYFSGPSTLSKDGKTLYLFINGKPNGPIMLKGIKNKIRRIWVLGKGVKLKHEIKMKAWWSSVPGLIFIDIPDKLLDEYITVIGITFNGKIQLFDNDNKK